MPKERKGIKEERRAGGKKKFEELKKSEELKNPEIIDWELSYFLPFKKPLNVPQP